MKTRQFRAFLDADQETIILVERERFVRSGYTRGTWQETRIGVTRAELAKVAREFLENKPEAIPAAASDSPQPMK